MFLEQLREDKSQGKILSDKQYAYCLFKPALALRSLGYLTDRCKTTQETRPYGILQNVKNGKQAEFNLELSKYAKRLISANAPAPGGPPSQQSMDGDDVMNAAVRAKG